MSKLCFTIRDMLWMTVVVALLVALWRERTLLTAEWEKVRAEKNVLVLTCVKCKNLPLERSGVRHRLRPFSAAPR
jgi:hypothetical protein